jgi:hypothetical protein
MRAANETILSPCPLGGVNLVGTGVCICAGSAATPEQQQQQQQSQQERQEETNKASRRFAGASYRLQVPPFPVRLLTEQEKEEEKKEKIASASANPCSVTTLTQYRSFAEVVIASDQWGFSGFFAPQNIDNGGGGGNNITVNNDIPSSVAAVDQQLAAGTIDILFSCCTAAPPPCTICDATCGGALPTVDVENFSNALPFNRFQEGCSYVFNLTNVSCSGSQNSLNDFCIVMVPCAGTAPCNPDGICGSGPGPIYVLIFPSLRQLVGVNGSTYFAIPLQLAFRFYQCISTGGSDGLLKPDGIVQFKLVWPTLGGFIATGTPVQFTAINILAIGCPDSNCTGANCPTAPAAPCTIYSLCVGSPNPTTPVYQIWGPLAPFCP